MTRPTVVLSVNSAWNILNFRMPLINALKVAGYRVVAFAPADGHEHQLLVRGVDYIDLWMNQQGTSPIEDAGLFFRYRSVLKDVRPACFLSFTAKPNVYGSLAARSLGIPVINNVSGLGTAFIRESWLTCLLSQLYRIAFRHSHTIFFQNRDDLDLFVDRRLVHGGKARLLPGSGIDLQRYQGVRQPGGSRIAFLLIARLLRDKGVGEYVEAARQLLARGVGAEFRLLGPADVANRTAFGIKDVEAWQAEGVISYLGVANDVRPHIERADCVVLPSYREGLPRTLLEGAAMGRPLIATNVPGCRDVVLDGISGLLCAPRDPLELAAAMEKMASLDPHARNAMGLAGRALVEDRFDERIVHRLYLDAIAAALHERHAER